MAMPNGSSAASRTSRAASKAVTVTAWAAVAAAEASRAACSCGVGGVRGSPSPSCICRRLGVLHDHARLVLGVGGRLEGLVDGRDGSKIGHRVGRAGALQRGEDGCRIAQRLVDEQVGDRAQARIEDQRAGIVRGIVVGCRRHGRSRPGTIRIEQRAVRRPVGRVEQGRELAVGGAPLLLAGQQVVVGAVDGAQAHGEVVGGHEAARAEQRLTGGMRLGDLDLLENELQIALDVTDHGKLPRMI